MNNAAVINIRTNANIKKQAQEIAKNLGLNLSALINAYLRQLIRTKTVSFSLEEEPSDYLVRSLEKSKKDIKNGYVSPLFTDPDEALKWLKNPKAKYANQL